MSRAATAQLLERPLPHSAEAERAILGSVLLDNSLVNHAVELLRPEDFYVRAHQFVFRSMISLSERGSEIDPLLLSEELRREGVLEQAGGMTFISELTYGLPHFTNVAAYAKVVKDHSLMRQLVKVANKITSEALEGEDEAAIILDHAEQMFKALMDEKLRISTGSQSNSVSLPELCPEALYGLAGDFVRLVAPHTEADRAALLFQFLVSYGSCVGRGPYFQIEADKHRGNLFALIVGATGSGRKGTSAAHVRRVYEAVDEDWARDCVFSGMSSGEGLIWSVRDPVEQSRPLKDKGRPTGQFETVVADRGVTDKRALVVESEFASVLRAQGREGNTLSAVIRQAWDEGNLRSLTKNSPARATGAHVSIIGHITNEELQRCLSVVERFNGYLNRFLFVLSRRSKFLPDGGSLGEEDLAGLKGRLSRAVVFARRTCRVQRDEGASALWREVYRDLSSRPAGLFGALTARAAPQVVRLSLLYALLDESECVRRVHLEAALALWRYSEDSVRYLFVGLTGDQLADDVLRELRAAGACGLTRTEINGALHGHRRREEIDRALSVLAEAGLAVSGDEQTAGRPIERWVAVAYPAEKAEEAEKGSPAVGAEGAYSASSAYSASGDLSKDVALGHDRDAANGNGLRRGENINDR
jgi:hypothetical protein